MPKPITMIAVGRYYDQSARKEHAHGQHFTVGTEAEADRLERRRKARRHRPEPVGKADFPAPGASGPTTVEPAVSDETTALRAEYEATVGKRPFMGWGPDELREKIAGYNRRDMQAEPMGGPIGQGK